MQILLMSVVLMMIIIFMMQSMIKIIEYIYNYFEKINKIYLDITNNINNINNTINDMNENYINDLCEMNEKLREMNETTIINIILSKLPFTPKHYNVIKCDNEILIKCHHYSNYDISIDNNYITYDYTNGSNIQLSLGNINIDNYNYKKNLSILVAEINIDLKNKKYTITTYCLKIITCIIDRENLYTKIITNLENPDYYIIINNIDTNYFEDYEDDNFYNLFSKKEKFISYYYFNKFNITIITDSNDYNNNDIIVINPIFIKQNNNLLTTTNKKSYSKLTLNDLSKDIHTKPHIHNYIGFNKISGTFI
jgi:hypothetical protein